MFTANLAEAEDDGDLLEFDGPPGSEKQVVARLALFRQWFAPIKLGRSRWCCPTATPGPCGWTTG